MHRRTDIFQAGRTITWGNTLFVSRVEMLTSRAEVIDHLGAQGGARARRRTERIVSAKGNIPCGADQ